MKLRIASLLAALCSCVSWANSRGTKSLEQTSPGWTSLTGHTRLITFPVTALANGRQLKLGWLLCVRASPHFSIRYHTGFCWPGRRGGRGRSVLYSLRARIHQFLSPGFCCILEVSKCQMRPTPWEQGYCKSGLLPTFWSNSLIGLVHKPHLLKDCIRSSCTSLFTNLLHLLYFSLAQLDLSLHQ